MKNNEQYARKQILQEYDDGIQSLQGITVNTDAPKNCRLASPMRRGLLLIMRYHQLQLQEEIAGKNTSRKFWESAKIALLAAVLATVLNPATWNFLGRMLHKTVALSI